ncbi:MAG: ABC transporter permease [Candidatus Omnitrophica bacterium]|nr:ABC transporter permease [Candidatus Omnitrophota bacterium]
MVTFIKIAWRNIVRNKKRSLITISAVGFGLGALIFIWSFVEGAHVQMTENYTSLVTGHIQIHQKGFLQQAKLETNMAGYPALLAKIRNMPSVVAVAPRIKAVGLISSTEASAGVEVIGVDPTEEKKLSRLAARIKTGQFLGETTDQDIVIGAALAKNLNVVLGDKIVVMSQALDGSIASGAYRVCGLMDTGAEEIDKGVVLITHAAAENLFAMAGRTSELAVRIKNVKDAKPAALQISEQLPSSFEVLPWQTVSPVLQQWIEFDEGFIWIIVFVVMIVVAIGILNTVLMGVLERTREFGILLGLGTQRGQIISMIAWESLFLGLIGCLAGLILGLTLSLYFHHAGIDLTVFTAALNTFYMDALIFPRVNFSQVVFSLFLVLSTSIIVSIYPAWLAARLKPIDAIRSL